MTNKRPIRVTDEWLADNCVGDRNLLVPKDDPMRQVHQYRENPKSPDYCAVCGDFRAEHPVDEEVVAMDAEKGPLVVRTAKDAPTVRLALRRESGVVYVTYERTAERDVEGRPVYR